MMSFVLNFELKNFNLNKTGPEKKVTFNEITDN